MARERVEPRLFPQAEARASGTLAGAGLGVGGWPMAGNGSATGPRAPESLSAVVACVELISGAVASLPASIMMDTPDGMVPAPASLPAVRLIGRPNDRQSWAAFAQMIAAQILLHGNSVSFVNVDGRGAVASLTPAPFGWLSPVVLPSNRLAFDVLTATPEAALLGLPSRLLASECLHVRARSDNGILGKSVLSRAAGVVHEGITLKQVAQANWDNGMRPSGIITFPDIIKKDQRTLADAMLSRFKGSMNVGGVPLLEGGMKYEQIALSSVDAEFLSTRQFSVGEIARLFAVPEPMIATGQRAPSDLAPYVTAFAQSAVAPMVSAVEAEFDYSVLPSGFHLQLDMAGLLRGNYSVQMAAACAAVQSRIFTPNDARRSFGLPAHADGDTLGAGPAPSWPADAAGMAHLGPSPGATGTGLPEPGNHGNEGAA